MSCQWSSVIWGKKESLTTTLQVQSSNSPLELEDRAHENLEDRQPNAPSLKKYVKEITQCTFLEEICERN